MFKLKLWVIVRSLKTCCHGLLLIEDFENSGNQLAIRDAFGFLWLDRFPIL